MGDIGYGEGKCAVCGKVCENVYPLDISVTEEISIRTVVCDGVCAGDGGMPTSESIAFVLGKVVGAITSGKYTVL